MSALCSHTVCSASAGGAAEAGHTLSGALKSATTSSPRIALSERRHVRVVVYLHALRAGHCTTRQRHRPAKRVATPSSVGVEMLQGMGGGCRVCVLADYLLSVSMICAIMVCVMPGCAFSALSNATLSDASAAMVASSVCVFSSFESTG